MARNEADHTVHLLQTILVHVVSRIVTAVLLVSTLPAHVSAQAHINLGAVPVCRQCSLELEPLVFLGEASGDGVIESAYVKVRYAPNARMFAVFATGKSTIQFFDSAGRYLRSIGRPGQGPKEVAVLADAQFVGSDIAILDARGPKLLVLDQTGGRVSDTRLNVRGGRFRVVTESTVVVGSIDRARPAVVGYPLHYVDARTGKPIHHFGSEEGDWNGLEPYAQMVILGLSPNPELVWWARPTPLRLEQWTIQGEHRRTVEGELPWFPMSLGASRDGPPPPLLVAFGVDSANRLWLLQRVPDPDWKAVRRRGNERIVVREDYAEFWDTRLDIFDLEASKHVATARWDEVAVDLVQLGGVIVVQRLIYETDLYPRVGLYRVTAP